MAENEVVQKLMENMREGKGDNIRIVFGPNQLRIHSRQGNLPFYSIDYDEHLDGIPTGDPQSLYLEKAIAIAKKFAQYGHTATIRGYYKKRDGGRAEFTGGIQELDMLLKYVLNDPDSEEERFENTPPKTERGVPPLHFIQPEDFFVPPPFDEATAEKWK